MFIEKESRERGGEEEEEKSKNIIKESKGRENRYVLC